MKARDIAAAIEDLAPLELAYEWDGCGISIGNPDAEVNHVLVALTLSRAALDRALAVGAHMIVTHHPAIFKSLKYLRTDDPATALVVDVATHGLVAYAAHTNYDIAPNGLNTVLGERFALRDMQPLLPTPHTRVFKLVCFVPDSHLAMVRDAVAHAGAGVIGNYTHCTFSSPGIGTFVPGDAATPYSGSKHALNEEEERRFEVRVPQSRLRKVIAALLAVHPYEEPAYDIVPLHDTETSIGLGVRGKLPEPVTLRTAAQMVREQLAVEDVRVVGPLEGIVHSVGVIGGAGGGEIRIVPHDIDLLITGDVRYHDALAALDAGMAVIDATHDGLEKWAVPALTGYLRRTLPGLAVTPFEDVATFYTV
jgi:dinuclear metal center YbgI/SA1388 family protein